MYVRCAHMFGAKATTERKSAGCIAAGLDPTIAGIRIGDRSPFQIGRDRPVLSQHLNRLDDPGGQLSSALDLGEVCVAETALAQRAAQDVGRCHRIGHGEVDADPTDGDMAPPHRRCTTSRFATTSRAGLPHVNLTGVVLGFQSSMSSRS